MSDMKLGSGAGTIRIVGHPFAPSGMGEHCRSVALALASAGYLTQLVDVHGHFPPQDDFLQLVADIENSHARVNVDQHPLIEVFTVNCDEIEVVLGEVRSRYSPARKSVIYPAWELPTIPRDWIRLIDDMDGVWTSSVYSQGAFSSSRHSVEVVGLSVRGTQPHFITRREFGIPENVHCALTSVHLASYTERKNPTGAALAIVEARRQLRGSGMDIRLVVKLNGGNQHPERAQTLANELESVDSKVVILTEPMDEPRYRGLVMACDSVLSLHRAEGFGFGIAEGMRMGRPVVCTAYSGNMDFCTTKNSYLVDYELKDVRPGDYPHGNNQVWAEPDVGHAAEQLVRLVSNEKKRNRLVLNGRVTAATQLSHVAVGLKMQTAVARLVTRD